MKKQLAAGLACYMLATTAQADVVIGSRNLFKKRGPGLNFFRYISSLFIIYIINFLLDNKVSTSETIINKIDFDKVFLGLVEAIEGSQLGGMLAMVGGRKALDPLKDPFTKKLKIIIEDFVTENTSNDNSSDTTASLLLKIENILDARLADLSPEDIKIIIQKMIKGEKCDFDNHPHTRAHGCLNRLFSKLNLVSIFRWSRRSIVG